jgi:hypothetical protein
MYLTAQRVRSKEAEGINVFRYVHRDMPVPSAPDGELAPDKVLSPPGYLVDYSADVPPGGNDVLSFLEVVGPDDVSSQEIVERLQETEAALASSELPQTWFKQVKSLVVRFNVIGLSGEPARQEFGALFGRLRAHLAKPMPPKGGGPVELRLIKTSEGSSLRLEHDSLLRLQREQLAPAATSISAAFEVADDFRRSYGAFLPHAIAALIGRDLHELVARGGVRVLDERDQIVWERLPPS